MECSVYNVLTCHKLIEYRKF